MQYLNVIGSFDSTEHCLHQESEVTPFRMMQAAEQTHLFVVALRWYVKAVVLNLLPLSEVEDWCFQQ